MEDTKKNDKMEAEEASRIRILVSEDIRKYELEIARHEAAISTLRVYIAECRATISDIDRREAGVEYPEAPAAKEPAKPAMGEPVGGEGK